MECGGGCLPFARCAARIRFTQHTKCAFPTKKTPARSDANELTCQNLCIYYGKQEIIHDLNFALHGAKKVGLLELSVRTVPGKQHFLKCCADLWHRELGKFV